MSALVNWIVFWVGQIFVDVKSGTGSEHPVMNVWKPVGNHDIPANPDDVVPRPWLACCTACNESIWCVHYNKGYRTRFVVWPPPVFNTVPGTG